MKKGKCALGCNDHNKFQFEQTSVIVAGTRKTKIIDHDYDMTQRYTSVSSIGDR